MFEIYKEKVDPLSSLVHLKPSAAGERSSGCDQQERATRERTSNQGTFRGGASAVSPFGTSTKSFFLFFAQNLTTVSVTSTSAMQSTLANGASARTIRSTRSVERAVPVLSAFA